MTVKGRFRRATGKGLCFLCLESGHKSNSSGRKTLCKHCKGRHHHLIHTDKPPQEKPPLEKTGPPESPSASQEEVPKDVVSNVTASSVGTNEFGNSDFTNSTSCVVWF